MLLALNLIQLGEKNVNLISQTNHHLKLFIFSFLLTSCASTIHSNDPVGDTLESAVMTIKTMINANDFYRTDYNKDALSFDMLEKMDYIMVDSYTLKILKFDMILEDDKLKSIVATTTTKAPVGEGKKAIFDVSTETWSGDLVELYRSQKKATMPHKLQGDGK